MPGKPEEYFLDAEASLPCWSWAWLRTYRTAKRELRRHRTSILNRSISPTTNSSGGPTRKVYGGSTVGRPGGNVGTAEEMFQSEHGSSHSASNEKLHAIFSSDCRDAGGNLAADVSSIHGMHFPWTPPFLGVPLPGYRLDAFAEREPRTGSNARKGQSGDRVSNRPVPFPQTAELEDSEKVVFRDARESDRSPEGVVVQARAVPEDDGPGKPSGVCKK